ncbi:MAG TPA: hypothetical protein VMH86_17195 [Rhizomicrobium sp.]|nr:hypothetical protein [Rhizomicrobium sp.]
MSGLYGIIRVVLTVMGVLMVLMGLLWIGQGTGLVMWPSSSFMLKDMKWAFNGALLANFGLLQLYILHRR